MAKEQVKRYRPRPRPLFLPHRQKSYEAVRPFTWKGQTLQPGDEVPEWPMHQMRHLYRRGLIGPAGDGWTTQRQEHWAKHVAKRNKITAARKQRQAQALEEQAAAEEQRAEEALVAADEARSLKDRIAGLFGGGEGSGRPAGDSSSA